MRVIVVDDDKIIRMGLIKILNKLFEDIEVVSVRVDDGYSGSNFDEVR